MIVDPLRSLDDFPVVRRGLDPQRVRAALSALSSALSRRDARIGELEAEVARLKEGDRVAAAASVGDEVTAVLAQAEVAARQIRKRAAFEGDLAERRIQSATAEMEAVHRALGEHLAAMRRLAASRPKRPATRGRDRPREAREIEIPEVDEPGSGAHQGASGEAAARP